MEFSAARDVSTPVRDGNAATSSSGVVVPEATRAGGRFIGRGESSAGQANSRSGELDGFFRCREGWLCVLQS